MFGFFIGALTVFGIAAVLKHRFWRRNGYGWYGHHPHPGPGPGFSRGGPWRGRGPYREEAESSGHRGADWMTDRLISRINATPEQAQVLRIEVGEFLKYARGLRSELGGYRTDIAEAMKADSFDATIMGESFGRQDDQLRELRERLVGSLARIHDVLEPEQREMVSELLEHGPRFGGRRRGW